MLRGCFLDVRFELKDHPRLRRKQASHQVQKTSFDSEIHVEINLLQKANAKNLSITSDTSEKRGPGWLFRGFVEGLTNYPSYVGIIS